MRNHRLFAVTILLLTAAVATPVATGVGAAVHVSDGNETIQKQDAPVGPTNVSQAVATAGNVTYVWQDGEGTPVDSYQLETEVTPTAGWTELCLQTNGSEACALVDDRETVTFTGLAPGEDGDVNVNLTLWNVHTGEMVTDRSFTLQPITHGGDLDHDGLSNGREEEVGTELTVADTDGDGLADGREFAHGTDPTAPDTDGDGLADGSEVAFGTSPTSTDTDGDGLSDRRELETGTDPTMHRSGGGSTGATEEDEAGVHPVVSGGDGTDTPQEVSPLAGSADWNRFGDTSDVDAPSGQDNPVWLLGGTAGFAVGLALAALVFGGETTVKRRLEAAADRPVRLTAPPAIEARPGGDSAPAVVEVAEEVEDAALVTAMLEAEGGRMRQSEIVEATGWSKAKVSRLLSRMAGNDEVAKIQLGRENLICLERAIPAVATKEWIATRAAG